MEDRMSWLRKQRTDYKAGRKRTLKAEDKEKVWSLMKQTQNKSMVADLLGVSQRTVRRFLQARPIPTTFVIEDSTNLEDFPEIQFWLQRQTGFAKQNTINGYMTQLRNFFEWIKQHHPEHAKPSLWTSDDILEYLYGNESKMTEGQVNDIIKDAGTRANVKDKVLTSKAFRKSFVKNAVECEINPLCLIGTGKGTPEHPKTALCVGWSSDIVFKHYAPQLLERIKEGRQRFSF